MKVFTLKKRKDFIRAAKGFKAVVNGIVLQAAFTLQKNIKENTCYVGYTATKKIGKAHDRNRTKRRLRALADIVMPNLALEGINYVLIGRHNTKDLDFKYLEKKLTEAFVTINKQIEAQIKQNDKKVDDCAD